jgi:hypothetical protein
VYLDSQDWYQLEDFVFNNEFTLELWVMPYSSGTLFSIESVFSWDILKNFKLNFEDFSSGLVTMGEWSHLVVAVKLHQVQMHVNIKQLGTHNLADKIVDSPFMDHKMGTGGYIGFYYKIVYATYMHDNFEPYR